MDELKKYRREIDTIDEKILLLLQKRFGVVEKIGIIKARTHAPIKDKKRMKELYKKRMKIAKKYNLPPKLVKNIYRDIIRWSMDKEKNAGLHYI